MNLKNSGDSTGLEPKTSAMPVQCSKTVVSLIHESSVKLRYYNKHMASTQRTPNELDRESHDNLLAPRTPHSSPPSSFKNEENKRGQGKKKNVPALKPNIVHGGEDGPI